MIEGFEFWAVPNMADPRKAVSHDGYLPTRPDELWKWHAGGNWTYTVACWCLLYMAEALELPCMHLHRRLREAKYNEGTVGDYLEAMLGQGNLSTSSNDHVLPRNLAHGTGEHSVYVLRATHVLLVVAAVEKMAFDPSHRFYEEFHRRQYSRWAEDALKVCLPPGPSVVERLRRWVADHEETSQGPGIKSREGCLRRKARDADRIADRSAYKEQRRNEPQLPLPPWGRVLGVTNTAG